MGTTHIQTGETKSAKAQSMTARVLSYIFLGFVTLLSLFPIYLLLINATRSHGEIVNGFSLIPSFHFLENLKVAFSDQTLRVANGMLNSFVIAASASILTSYFSAMTAYGVHVYDFKLKKFAFNFIMIIMMIPTQISAVGFVKLVGKDGMGLDNTFWPLIIPAIAAPSVFFYMKQYIESALPMEVIEAARVDGSNEFRTFNMIALPMLKPALSVQVIFAFTASWNNFFTPALILNKDETRTLPIMISFLRTQIAAGDGNANWGKVYMTMLLAIIPVVIVYIIVSKNIVEGVALGAVKG